MSKFLHAIGNEIVLDFWLTKSESEDDIKGIPRDKDDHSIVRIYVVASVQIYALHCIAYFKLISCWATNIWRPLCTIHGRKQMESLKLIR